MHKDFVRDYSLHLMKAARHLEKTDDIETNWSDGFFADLYSMVLVEIGSGLIGEHSVFEHGVDTDE